MKKRLLLTSMLLASTSVINLKAQITFTSADLQEAGKTYVTENGTHYPLALVKADNNNVIRSVEYYFMQGFLGTEIINESESFTLYPNPSEGLLMVELNTISTSVNSFVLTDSFGKIVKEISLDQLQNSIDCSSLKSGIYFYTISSGIEIETGQLIIR